MENEPEVYPLCAKVLGTDILDMPSPNKPLVLIGEPQVPKFFHMDFGDVKDHLCVRDHTRFQTCAIRRSLVHVFSL